ncbi:MAG: hypothetical protein CFE37_13065 [Alphaproteobacteria bacterium PA4]|nr:MAG: hypothetical protein CFE37_13065 [Alphaproteobacteria bacterium PA4]
MQLLAAADAAAAAPGRRTLCLVTYLALAGDAEQRRDYLAGLIWERRGVEQARASLRQCLVDLKSQFPGLLLASRTSLRLDPALLTTDLAGLAGLPSAAALAAAIARLPQHLLVLPAIGTAFDTWVAGERARLLQRLGEIVRARLADAEASADDRAALRAAWQRFQPDEAPASGPRPATAAAAPAPPARRLPGAIDPPLLIMPPVEFSGIAEGQDLAEQLRDEVVGGLARIRDLRLIVERQPIAAIPPDRHGPCFVLHSRLRNLSDGPHLSLQLFSWPDQQILWSTSTPFALAIDQQAVDRVVGEVVGKILPEMERGVRLGGHAASGSLYVRYLHARHAARQPENFAAARAIADEFEAIIAQDPSFVLAYLPLARLYNTDFVYTRAGSSGVTERDRAHWLARRVIELDNGHGHGHSLLAWCHLWRGEWHAAETCLEEALKLNPYSADRLDEIAFAYMHLGRLDRAAELLERSKALMIAPSHIYWNDRTLLELLNGDPGAAVRAAANAGSDYLWSSIYSLAAHAHAGLDCRAPAQLFRARVGMIFPNGQLPSFDDLAFWMRRSGMPFRHTAQLNVVLDGIRIGLGQRR